MPDPVPESESVTVSVKLGGGKLNVAVTAAAAFIVITQLPVPLQAPPQPANTDPLAGVAVKVTTVPPVKLDEHPLPQLIPSGLLVTFPAPVPASDTVSV